MLVELTEFSRNSLANSIRDKLIDKNNGSVLELYKNKLTEFPNSDDLLVRLLFNYPSASDAKKGIITFTLKKEGSIAVNSGIASWARIINNKDILLYLDVGDPDSGCIIELGTSDIRKGGKVIIPEIKIEV